MTGRNPAPAAALPPSAAELAAGIASIPQEALVMPAAPFSDVDAPSATRQHAIERNQCRWIIAAEDAGADALMCGAPAERRRSFCTEHCELAYMKPENEDVIESEEDVASRKDEEQDEETEAQAADGEIDLDEFEG